MFQQLSLHIRIKIRNNIKAVITVRIHLYPYRTEKLSSLVPMVLHLNVGEQVAALFGESEMTPLFCLCLTTTRISNLTLQLQLLSNTKTITHTFSYIYIAAYRTVIHLHCTAPIHSQIRFTYPSHFLFLYNLVCLRTITVTYPQLCTFIFIPYIYTTLAFMLLLPSLTLLEAQCHRRGSRILLQHSFTYTFLTYLATVMISFAHGRLNYNALPQ